MGVLKGESLLTVNIDKAVMGQLVSIMYFFGVGL